MTEAILQIFIAVGVFLLMIALFALGIAVLVRVMRFTFDLFDLW